MPTKRTTNLPLDNLNANGLKGLNVLTIPDAEVLIKDDDETHVESGILNVLFIPEYSRFILQLNNWLYALIKELPITATGHPGSDSMLIYPTRPG